MRDSAAIVPGGIKSDADVLYLYPDAHGMQHDEVKAGLGLLTKMFRVSWTKADRKLPASEGGGPSRATMHRSVYERFDGAPVQQYDRMALYRPETLRHHVDFQDHYIAGTSPSVTSLFGATAVAAEPVRGASGSETQDA